MTNELLAQLIEVTSVGVAGMKLRKHITVPRPAHLTPEGRASAAHDTDMRELASEPRGPQQSGFDKAFALLAATQPRRSRGA